MKDLLRTNKYSFNCKFFLYQNIEIFEILLQTVLALEICTRSAESAKKIPFISADPTPVFNFLTF